VACGGAAGPVSCENTLPPRLVTSVVVAHLSLGAARNRLVVSIRTRVVD